jgi:hypothetical protein
MFIYRIKITILGVCVDYVGIAFLMLSFSYVLFAKCNALKYMVSSTLNYEYLIYLVSKRIIVELSIQV